MTTSGEERRVVVVTGGSRGIGRSVCLAFADPATRVYVNYAASAGQAEETRRLVEARGGAASCICADVSKESDVAALFKTVVAESGRIDVLVNNAGIARDGLVPRMSEADWDDVMAANLKGAFFCIKAASRQMLRQRGGRIITISSVVGFSGNAGQANYAASKAGLMGLTRSVALEFASRNITVNAVAPGLIATDMAAGLSDPERERIAERIPLGRLGTPDDVAGVVAFLASDAAAYITGQVIHVNGGMYM
ncbi:MAG: 3-oxoacyl-[acyl-carrier-protein] reductase [Thermodesulfobacteriota bacterium]